MNLTTKIVAATFAVVLVVSGALSAHAQDPAAQGQARVAAMLEAGAEPVRIVCFGDSVTGLYYHTGGRRTYSDMLQIALQRLYPAASVTVINAGISGNNTVNALARIETDVLAHKPHLVTIMFGLNDITNLTMEQYAENLASIITQCRAAGSEVLLCTPNAVEETERRPSAKLEEYIAALQKVAVDNSVPVVDCYAAYQQVRAKDPLAFAFLMSDEIHPNMDGHKLFAQVIAEAIAGKPVSLEDVESPFPAMPKTLALLKEGKPVRVYAMPPYDALIAPALLSAFPSATIEVTAWPVEGRSVAQLEADAKPVREMGVDLVIVAVPADANAESPEKYLRSYSWVMNYALSFAHQEWDVIAFPPSTANPALAADENEPLARQRIHAQDLGTITRADGDETPVAQLLEEWVKEQFAESGTTASVKE
ncbi:MAG: SGNH/GDSL hydrolase family protein [Candidatus Hydrogenedentes bacterium]|nr:SGNH/GDSL hydrolase family protein [Candidatus Hydrogenedentota bacterium]